MAIELEEQEILAPEIKQETGQIVSRAKSLAAAIRSDATYADAMSFLTSIKGMRKKITEFFLPMKQKAKAVHDQVCASEREADTPLAIAEKAIKDAGTAYFNEQQKKAQEKADLEAAEARKKAETERLEKAQALKDAGESRAAEAVLEEPTVIEPVKVEDPVKVGGISYSEKWSASCPDLKALVKAVADGRAPICLLEYNEKEGNRLAKAMKKEMIYDGIHVYAEKVMSARAK